MGLHKSTYILLFFYSNAQPNYYMSYSIQINVFQIDHEAFSESFTNALHYLFLFGEANGNVDRVMQFVANFCGSLSNEGEEFMHYIFEVIFNVSIAIIYIKNDYKGDRHVRN